MEWRGRIGPTDEVTLSEAAEMLDLPPREIRVLVEIGEIPARTNRLLTYISLADIDIYRLRTRLAISPAARRATSTLGHAPIAGDSESAVPASSAAAGA
jgi:hypothetical protein